MIRYNVTLDDCSAMIRHELLQKKTGKVTRTEFWFGVGAPLLLGWLWASLPAPRRLWQTLVSAGGILICWGIVLFGRFFVELRTRILTKQYAKKLEANPDFFRPHRLSLHSGFLHCEYGNFRQKADCRELSDPELSDGLLLLRQDGRLLDMVPLRELPQAELQTFLEELEDARHKKEKAELAAHLASVEKDVLGSWTLHLSREEAAALFVRIKRHSFRTVWGYELSRVCYAGAATLTILYAGMQGLAALQLAAAAVLLVLVLPDLLCFLPFYRAQALQNTIAPGPDGYRLVLTARKLYLYGGYQVIAETRADLKYYLRLKDGTLALYFAKRRMLFVTAGAAEDFLVKYARPISLAVRAGLSEREKER